jgi:hypothetical protein
MDWQQIIALLIVGVTALCFVVKKFWRQKFHLKETHCGCGSAPRIGPKQSIQFHARKGERAKIIIKNQANQAGPGLHSS